MKVKTRSFKLFFLFFLAFKMSVFYLLCFSVVSGSYCFFVFRAVLFMCLHLCLCVCVPSFIQLLHLNHNIVTLIVCVRACVWVSVRVRIALSF